MLAARKEIRKSTLKKRYVKGREKQCVCVWGQEQYDNNDQWPVMADILSNRWLHSCHNEHNEHMHTHTIQLMGDTVQWCTITRQEKEEWTFKPHSPKKE